MKDWSGFESNKLITNSQCGFRKRRSTIDHVVKLETSIREAKIQKQHLIAVFFDLEKAYDTTWRFGIMKDQHSMGLRGRLPKFIKNFLSDKKFWVQAGSTFSNLHKHFVSDTVQYKNKQHYKVSPPWYWGLPLCWWLLHHFQIQIYTNCCVSIATMHLKNYSLG